MSESEAESVPVPASVEAKNEKPGVPQEWFGIKDVASMLGVSGPFVRRHVLGGTMESIDIGSPDRPLYRVHRSTIDAWSAERRGGAKPGPAKRKAEAPVPFHNPYYATKDSPVKEESPESASCPSP